MADPFTSGFDAVQKGWAIGGLSFIFFVAMILLYTERVVSGKRHKAVVAEWSTRYDTDTKSLKTDLAEEKRRGNELLQMLLHQMDSNNRNTSISERLMEKVK